MDKSVALTYATSQVALEGVALGQLLLNAIQIKLLWNKWGPFLSISATSLYLLVVVTGLSLALPKGQIGKNNDIL